MSVSAIKINQIVVHYADQFGVTIPDLFSDKRYKEIAGARHRIYAGLHLIGTPYAEIGRIMRRHHTTVMHGVQKVLG